MHWRGLLAPLEAEQSRWFLWLPVLFGAGIAVYFAVPAEPALGTSSVLLLLAAAMHVALRSRGLMVVLGAGLAALAAGFVAAEFRAWTVAAPILERPLPAASLTGWIERVEARAGGGARLTLRVHSIRDLAPALAPYRVRITVPSPGPGGNPGADRPGDGITVVARLNPPPLPALPGAFDFARSAWFQRLGAVGSSRLLPSPVEIAEPLPRDLRLKAPVERLRLAIGRRVAAALPGETGAIAQSLIMGERGGISDATNTAFRDSGLLHILSISGLHMTIMAGAVFFSVRLALSLLPALALRLETKKLAAIAAAIAALGYLLISGSSPPTVRAYLMISIMFLAVLLDRSALALRNVALAALVTLALMPESLIDVGFQMSFAAVTALIAAYEVVRARSERRAEKGRERGLIATALLLFAGIVLSTLIASLAVAPFAAYHFHKSQQYAIIANLMAIPICNILVMPAALATLVAMPFGLERWPLLAMGVGIDAMVWCAYTVAALPGAVWRIPAFSSATFAVMVVGGLWLVLWQGVWRWLGVPMLAIGIAFAAGLRERPDVLVGRDGRLVAARGSDGKLAVLADRSATFELERWLEHDGDARHVSAVGPGALFVCDWAGCTARLPAGSLAISRHSAALRDDCRLAVVVIAPTLPAGSCAGPQVLIDRARLDRFGTHVIRFRKDRVPHVDSVAAARGRRLWTRHRPADVTRDND